MLRTTTSTGAHPATFAPTTFASDAEPARRSHRHVLVGPDGQGGVTVSATPLESAADVPPGPGLLALADLLVVGATERALADTIVAWREGGSVWLRLPVEGLRVVLEERSSAAALTRLSPAADPGTGRFVWADVDRRIGEVAARAFGGHDHDDDAVGFRGAMALTRRLGRPLLVQLATGSVLTTRPAPRGRVEIGGAVRPAPQMSWLDAATKPRSRHDTATPT